MKIQTQPYVLTQQLALRRTVAAVCQSSRWMATRRFEPDAAWSHALNAPSCQHHLLLVATTHTSQVVGWGRLFPEENEWASAELGIGLLSSYRNQGLGTQLVRRALAWAIDRRLAQVRLATAIDNGRAIHVFEKCGFSVDWRVNQSLLEMSCSPTGMNRTSCDLDQLRTSKSQDSSGFERLARHANRTDSADNSRSQSWRHGSGYTTR